MTKCPIDLEHMTVMFYFFTTECPQKIIYMDALHNERHICAKISSLLNL